ncbi:carboxypeptidase regulatory-like domain-containing protein [Marinigracilibium pacificum]|nr:carboxypeptidase regulatory-like domain-containing protein [Marinigracilibium pacificum]
MTIFMISCASGKKQSSQGVIGKVMWYEGNFMPTMGDNSQRDKPIGVERKIYVFKPIKTTSLEISNNTWAKDISEEPIKIIESDKSGNFKISLPEGKYTLLSKEEAGYYINSFDGDNIINPVEVRKNSWTEVEIRLDYKASY